MTLLRADLCQVPVVRFETAVWSGSVGFNANRHGVAVIASE
jgi:hypothetical protein